MSRLFASFLLGNPTTPLTAEACEAAWLSGTQYTFDGSFHANLSDGLDQILTHLNDDFVNDRDFQGGDVLVELVWYQWDPKDGEPDPAAYLLLPDGNWHTLPWKNQEHTQPKEDNDL